MNKGKIIRALKNNVDALSAKGLAANMQIDATSECLRQIEENCWELVNSGNITAIDLRDKPNGALFFRIINAATAPSGAHNNLGLKQ